jgi:hypothetical protein
MATDKKANKGSTLDELIDTLVKRAPELHAIGATSIAFGDFSATLQRPPPAAAAEEEPKTARKTHADPLQDRSTFPGGRLPGYQRPEGA